MHRSDDAASSSHAGPRREGRPRVLVLALAALGLCLAGFDGCWTTPALLLPGEYGVGLDTSTVLVDAERGREIPVWVWYPAEGEPGVAVLDAPPADGGPWPLIVSAHGLGDSPASLSGLHEHLASHGFLVAAPKFPGSILESPQSELTNDIVNHPGDVSQVIDAALGLGGAFPPALVGAADPYRVGMIGLSFGGLATYLTSFDRELRDPRVQMAVTMAGGGGDLFQPLFYDFVRRPLPLLAIHGTSDALVEYESVSGAVLANGNWPVTRLALLEGSHIGYVQGVPVFPGRHPDFLACFFLPPVDPNDPEIEEAFAYLAGRVPDTGIATPGDAPLPCTFGEESKPSAMAPARQLDLVKVGVLAFALSHLSDDPYTRTRAAAFLHETFEAENADATLEHTPFSWDWLGLPW